MNVNINYSGFERGIQALALDDLSTALNNDGISCKTAVSNAIPGEKGDVATGLIIIGLAVQSIGTFINAITFYLNGRPSYTVTIKRGTATCTIGNISAKDAVSMLESQGSTEDIDVDIVKGK